MEIIKTKNYIENRFKTSLALGNFDGVHLGHSKLIKAMIRDINDSKTNPSILLFNKHPKEVLFGKSPEVLTSFEDKEKILAAFGVKTIYKVDFTEEFRMLSPEDFVKKFLVEKLNVESVYVGFDYRFGFKASGDVETLKLLGRKYHFKVNVIEAVYDKDNILSSTEIRSLIRDGNIGLVNEMLGRNYKITGKVVHGNKIGRTLGFPTANIELDTNYQIPKIGVYKTQTIIDKKSYLSLTSIGTNPTVGGDVVKLESYILDFDNDIYGEKIEVEFLEYIRGEMYFSNLEDLKQQMQKDVAGVINIDN